MSILPGTKAPWFSSIGFQENKFVDISLNDYTGKWLILFFYPLDFGYSCPREHLDLEKHLPELELLNCRFTNTNPILIIAFIFHSSRLLAVAGGRWHPYTLGYGGVFGAKFPLMEDKDGSISKLYTVDKAYFIIDPSGAKKSFAFKMC